MPDFAFLATIGILLIVLGFLLVIAGTMRAKESTGEGTAQEKVKSGGVILIGPVPIVFGTDKRYALLLIILAIILMLLAGLYLK